MQAIIARGPRRITVIMPRWCLHLLYKQKLIDEWQEILKKEKR